MILIWKKIRIIKIIYANFDKNIIVPKFLIFMFEISDKLVNNNNDSQF